LLQSVRALPLDWVNGGGMIYYPPQAVLQTDAVVLSLKEN
jgi:hypothetical protein